MLAFLATSLSIVAFAMYNWKILLGESYTQISSWYVWAFITLLNFTTLRKLNEGWVKSILPTINSLMCILTALLLAIRASHGELEGRLGTTDQICLTLGVSAAICWIALAGMKKKNAAATAQIILQVALGVGFIPILIGVSKTPASEPMIPWLIWTLSFALQFVVTLTEKPQTDDVKKEQTEPMSKRVALIYPTSMFFFHGVVFLLSLRQI